eukprot:GHVQ01009645.1.p1 GENE.GHVQ01009645.1~~GHVQ01009645.1.p1  ORF type:complete len:232 (-),score=29.65 GHVQ01009645.1:430-1125(-)
MEFKRRLTEEGNHVAVPEPKVWHSVTIPSRRLSYLLRLKGLYSQGIEVTSRWFIIVVVPAVILLVLPRIFKALNKRFNFFQKKKPRKAAVLDAPTQTDPPEEEPRTAEVPDAPTQTDFFKSAGEHMTNIVEDQEEKKKLMTTYMDTVHEGFAYLIKNVEDFKDNQLPTILADAKALNQRVKALEERVDRQSDGSSLDSSFSGTNILDGSSLDSSFSGTYILDPPGRRRDSV